MEIGLHLPSAQSGADAVGIVEVARAAERNAFESVWFFDHLFTPVRLGSAYPYSRDGSYALGPGDPFFDPLALYGVLAAATTRIKLATGVLIGAYRHPIVLGKVLASVERFAPGRLILGLGAGWMREEFDALGVDPARRSARADEYVRALRAVWSGRSAFEGDFYRWPEAGFEPAPSAPIPIIVGGHGDAALRRAARVGDGWAIALNKEQGSTLDDLERRLDFLRARLADEGRDPASFHLAYQSLLWFSDSPHPKLPLTGPPDAIAASLARLGELGVTMVDLVVFGPALLIVETAERFAQEVRPLL
ncbi:MAG: TIGR03619 family F420-dependent LLM class oxidoreductase [Actinomycetota bacterium]